MRSLSWLMSPATPSVTRKSASLDKLHAENGRPCSAGLDVAIFLISRRWRRVNFGGWPPLRPNAPATEGKPINLLPH